MKALITAVMASLVLLTGCSKVETLLPVIEEQPSSDFCEALKSNNAWLDGAVAAESRWGIPIYVSLAELNLKIGTESSRYIDPIAGDWEQYRISTEAWDASPADVDSALDFIGWHGRLAVERNQLRMEQAGQLYLASRLGHGGFLRYQQQSDLVLSRQSEQVDLRAAEYRDQLKFCPRIRERAGSFFRWPW